MKKILVLGCGGLGKSTFSKQIGELTGIQVYHLDTFFWKPGYIATPNEEWDNFIKDIVLQEEWIIEGNYVRTLDLRIKHADTIVLFDMPRMLSIFRLIKRKIMIGSGKKAVSEECQMHFNIEQLKWVWNYNKHVKPKILEKLNEYAYQKNILTIKKPYQVKEFLDSLKKEYESSLSL